MLTKNYLATYAKSFNWAGFFLPKKTYDKCSALYDFCREADNIADDPGKLEDKIIKFENLSNEIKFIYSKLGIKNFKIEHHNSSNIKKFEHKKVNLNKKNKEIIYNIYKEDFSNFGYLP